MKLKRIVAMAAPLLLAGSGIALASTTGFPIDVPFNAGGNIVSHGVGYLVGAVGIGKFGLQCLQHHDYVPHFSHLAMTGVGATMALNLVTVAPLLGGAAAATIRLIS